MVNRRLALLALLAVAVAVVNASVFVYYPVLLNVQPTAPPITLEAGGNAGQNDLSGTIDVTIGPNKTSAVITVHPTYETTYYEDILQIKSNNSAPTLYLKIDVTQPLDSANGKKGYLILHIPGGTQQVIDLTQAGAQPSNWITVNSGDTITVDIQFMIPENTRLPNSLTVKFQIVYTNNANAASIPQPQP